MYIVKTLRENESEINAHTFIFNNIDCLCEFLKTQDCFNEHYLKELLMVMRLSKVQ